MNKKTKEMEKIIEADILDLDDFFEKYNKELVSKDLIDYILENLRDVSNKAPIKIILNKKIKFDLESILRNSFLNEYQRMVKEHFYNNKMQVIYFLIGVVMLIISILLNDKALLEELFLIGGWVLIWQAVEIEFFGDALNRKKRKLLKRLINCKIIEKEIK